MHTNIEHGADCQALFACALPGRLIVSASEGAPGRVTRRALCHLCGNAADVPPPADEEEDEPTTKDTKDTKEDERTADVQARLRAIHREPN